jgi:hypothetical protein
MRLKFAHLADFATVDVNKKPCVMGIFDKVLINPAQILPGEKIGLPHFYLLACIVGTAIEAGLHKVVFRIMTPDGQEGMKIEFDQVPFTNNPGEGCISHISQLIPGLQVPETGDYAFEVWAAGSRIGEVPFSVVEYKAPA